MNERIRELAEQAGMIVGDAGEFDMAKFMPKEVKFAELIIRECADIATINSNQWHGAGSYVLKHFEIK